MAHESFSEPSVDNFVEEYQKKLKHLQKIEGIKYSENKIKLDPLQNANPPSKLEVKTSANSFEDFENQLIGQFREYKDVKDKLERVKQELQQAYNVQVSVEAVKELEKVAAQKKALMEEDLVKQKQVFIESIKELESTADKKKQTLDHDFLKYKKKINDELNQLEQQRKDRELKFNDQVEGEKQQLLEKLASFEEQFEKKRHFWDLEKVRLVELIDQERYQWNQEKHRILDELKQERQKKEAEITHLDEVFKREKEQWEVKNDSLVKALEKEKKILEQNIASYSDKIIEKEKEYLNSIGKCETVEMILYEKEQELDVSIKKALKVLDQTHESRLQALELEYQSKESDLALELNKKKDQYELDYSQRTACFEQELAERRRMFEEELLTRRQRIIDECKQEQKVELEHALEFEKEKYNKQKHVLEVRLQSKETELNQQRCSFEKDIDFLKTQILELETEKKSLSQEVLAIEDRTRKNTRISYEDTYKHSLDRYKQEAQKTIDALKESNQQLDNLSKQKEVDISELKIKVKRLEGQLNRYVVSQASKTFLDSSGERPKIVRNQSRMRRNL